MHSTRLCKNILIVLLAFSALFGVVACSNLSGGDAPVNSAIQPANGVGVVRGTINSNQSTARTALPTTPTTNKYKITATASGFATVEKEFTTTDFELALPYNGSTTWTLKASALDTADAEVMSGTVTITLSDATPTATQNINVAYSQTGTGSVDLNISWSAASVENVKYELVRGSTKKTDTATASSLTISQTNLAAGAYSLAVEFYGEGGSLLYRVDETVNVYANLETAQFEGNAPYISGGGISVDQTLLDNFKISTIYVGGRGLISNQAASDSNNGSQFAPLATLKKAVEKANATGAGIENIIVQGNTTEAVFPDWAEVKYTGATALTITGKGANRGTTVAVNGNLVIQGDVTINNLTLVGTEVQVENSGVLTISEATLKDHTGWGSGGIKVVDSGKATVTNCTIKDNQVINDPNANPVWGGTGGGLYIDTTRTVEVKDCIIQNNNAQRFGGAIYIRSAQNVTLENCTISGNTVTTGNCPGIYNAGNLTLKGTQTFGADQDIYLAQKAGASPAAVHTITLGDDIDISAGSKIKVTPAITTAGTGILTANTAALITNNMNKFTLDGGLALKANGTKAVISAAKISPVYLKGTGGSDSNSGKDADNAVATLAHALEILDTDATSPTIVVVSKYTIKTGETLDFSAYSNPITIKRGNENNRVISVSNSVGYAGKVTLDNVILDGNKTEYPNAKAGFLEIGSSEAEVTIQQSAGKTTILKDSVSNTSTGGAIYNKGKLTINGGTISGNTANEGGAIYNTNGTVTINGGTISDNVSETRGGAICNSINSKLIITGGTISGNILSSSTGKGKGIYNSGTLQMSGAAQIAENNDVYLSATTYYVSIDTTTTPPLNPPDPTKPVAVITPYRYTGGDKILGSSNSKITEDVCKMFAITPDTSTTPATEWSIAYSSTTTGILDVNSKFETIYLNGAIGNDNNFGNTNTNAVKTLKKALTRLDTKAANPTIVVLREYTLASGETLDFSDATAYPKPITIQRGIKDDEVMKITSGTVTIKNVIFDGKRTDYYATGSLLHISGSSTDVTIGNGAVLQNNNSSSFGGGIYNEGGKLTISGATISGNEARVSAYGGGIYNNGTLIITDAEITGNTASNGGGIYNGGTVEISGGTISDNTANASGGGIYNSIGTVEITGGTISGNTASNNGKGIYNYGTLEMSGTAQVADDNDVYLGANKFITVTDAFTVTGTVANITLSSSAQYVAGTQVLDLSAITDAADKTAVCGKFKLLNSDGTENIAFVIKPKTGEEAKGILAAPQGSGGIILALPATYDITFGSTLSSNQIQRGNELSFTVKENGIALTTATYSITLKQNGDALSAPTVGQSIIIPGSLPAGIYEVYITVTVGSNTYDYTKQITVTM